MKIRRFFIISLILLLSSSLYATKSAEAINKTITTTFTANTSCFSGFSKIDVTSAAQLSPTETYTAGEKVTFNFDPVNSQYYTDTFYAYCQAFSTEPLVVTVSAPSNLTDTKNSKSKIPYTLIYTDTGHSVDWGKPVKSTYKASISESGQLNGARVVMSQPIKIVVNASEVKHDKIYTVVFKLEVKTK